MKKITIGVFMALLSSTALFAESDSKGKVLDGQFSDSRIMPGTVHHYKVYIPAQYQSGTSAALYVSQDGMRGFEPDVFDRLITEKRMPVCIGIFVLYGHIPATLPGGTARIARCPQYDGLGSAYADFIIDELLPEVAGKFDLKFSTDPNLHTIGGNSSGGICAFNAAWERNDFFRRVYMSSPSFVAFRGGDIFPALVRKTEPKPIRVYMTAGTDDMRNSGGDWHLQALSMNEALKYSNYDFRFESFEGGRHGAGCGDPAVFERVQTSLWADWETPVQTPKLPPRIADVFEDGTRWEKTSEKMPAAASVPFRVSKNRILNSDGDAATDETFDRLSGIALSTDRWRLYIADESSRYIAAMSLTPEGTLKDRYNIGWLHIPDDAQNCGAAGVCVDCEDRIFAATALGVQLIDNNGHNQAILPLPDGTAATAVCFSEKMLYVSTADGNVFKRSTKTGAPPADGTPVPPGQIGL